MLQDQPQEQKSSTGKRVVIGIAIVALLGALGGGGYWLYLNDFSIASLTALVSKPAPKPSVSDVKPAPPPPAPPVAPLPVDPPQPAGKTEQQIRDEVEAEMKKAKDDAAAQAEASRKVNLAAAKAKADREKSIAELDKAKADAAKAKAEAGKAKADADKAIAIAAATAAKPAPAPVQSAIRHPQDACADRPNFISREICLGRECERPEKFDLPFCRDRRARNQSTNPVGGSSNP